MHLARFLLLGCVFALSGCASSIPIFKSSQRVPSSSLNGAISSATSTAYQRWFSQLAAERDLYSELQVTSSGQAIQQLLADKVDFASTDTPPSNNQMKAGLIAFPVTASSVALAYNHPGCKLSLSLQKVAAILEGQITNYRELGCSSQDISVFYRSGHSGTTANLNTALSASIPGWKMRHGSSMELKLPNAIPVSGGLALRDQLIATSGSFSYLDSAVVAFPLQSARLQNGEAFLPPDQVHAERSLDFLKLDKQFLGSLQKPPEGYPIIALNWLVVRRGLDPSKVLALRQALQWIYSKRGQEDSELLGYLRIPVPIRQRALQQLTLLP